MNRGAVGREEKVYFVIGGAATGFYFIAFAIAGIVYQLPASILTLMFPVLSGMEEGRKKMGSC
jgi:O-antigen/teichoic acid export membrane protein